MFTVLRGIVYFVGVILLAFFAICILTYMQDKILGTVFSVAFLVVSVKFLEWVITR